MRLWPFSCQHPAAALAVLREQTVDSIDRDFERVTYHFSCTFCGAVVEIRHARTIGGVDAFLRRSQVERSV